jgi:hypothetical protein
MLLKLFNKIEREKKLSNSFYEVDINQVPKLGNDMIKKEIIG